MKFFIANILLVCCLFFTNAGYSQLPQCCRTKKVKIKKGKKKRKGTLRGVKGHDDKKALRNKVKQTKKEAKARKNEKKQAAKEEKELAKQKEKELSRGEEGAEIPSKEESIIEDGLKDLEGIEGIENIDVKE